MFGIRGIAINKVTQIVSAIDNALKSMIMSLRGDTLRQPLSNGTIFDSSSSIVPVTTTGNVQQGTPSPFGPGQSYYFSGSGSYLYLTTPTRDEYNFGTGDFTVEMWFYSIGTPSAGAVLYEGRGDDAARSALYIASDGQVYVARTQVFGAVSSITTGKWYHMVVTRAGGTLRQFVNGALTNTLSNYTVDLVAPFQRLRIGTNDAGSGTFNGFISNLRVVKGTAVYTSAFTPPTSNLTAVTGTTLLTLQNATLVDNSSSAATFANGGNVTRKSFSPFSAEVSEEITFIPTTSTYFSGTSDRLTATLATPIRTNDFTIEGWVKPSTTENRGIFQLSAQPGGLLSESVNTLSFVIDSAGINPWGVIWGNGYTATSVTATTAGWMHFAMVRTNGVSKLYLNGTMVASTTDSVDYTCTYLAVGGYFETRYLFKGNISNFRIVNGTAVYTSNFTPPTGALRAIAGTAFLGLQCNTQVDNSANSLAIAVNGSPRVTGFTPFSGTYGSAYFDGAGDYLTVGPSDSLSLGTGDYTIETWVKFTASDATVDIIGNYVSSSATDWMILRTAGNQIHYYPSGGNSWITGPYVVANVWYHIAAVRSSGVIQLYVDGVAYSNGIPNSNGGYTVTASIGDATRPVYVGTRAAIGNFITAQLANTRIVKGTAVYSSNFSSPTAPTISIAGTSLLLNYGNYTMYDSAGANIFTVTGTPTIDNTIFKDGTGSLRFMSNGYFSAQNPNLAWGTGDFTIEFWMYSSNVSPAQLGMFQTSTTLGGIATSYTTGIHLLQGVSTDPNGIQGNFAGAISGTIGRTTYGSLNQVITTDAWYHIAVVRRSGVLKTYVNGVSVDSRACTDNVTANNICIGGYYSGGYLYNGRLDAFRVHNFAKYTENFTPQ